MEHIRIHSRGPSAVSVLDDGLSLQEIHRIRSTQLLMFICQIITRKKLSAGDPS
jgi:hypothetical protein